MVFNDMATEMPNMKDCLESGYLFLVRQYSLAVCELYCQSFVTSRSTKQVVRAEHSFRRSAGFAAEVLLRRRHMRGREPLAQTKNA